MAETNRIVGDVTIVGNLSATGVYTGNVPRSSLLLETGAPFPILPTDWRIHDAYQSLLGTGSGDDLGIATGTYGTQLSYVRTPDLNGLGGPNNYRARFLFRLPENYDAGRNLLIRALSGMTTAVAATSATIDFEVRPHDGDLTVSADVVTTSAQSINNLVFSTFDFDVTGTGLSVGLSLDIRVTMAIASATASSHFGAMSRCEILVPIRG